MKKIILIILGLFQYSHASTIDNVFSLLQISTQFSSDWIEMLNQHGIKQNKRATTVSTSALPLFQAVPSLKVVPYVSLADLPTPIQHLENLGELLQTDLYVKHDGMTGHKNEHGRKYGGNKVRKLEFLLGEALALGAKEVITFGCVGSDHAVATSVYAHELGLRTLCLLKPQPNSCKVQHNLEMHYQCDTELHYYENNTLRELGALSLWFEGKAKSGEYPYLIPTGGSNPIGVLGFVNAAFELKKQIDEGLLPKPDFIYVPCGSAGTTAGLLLGCKAAGLDTKIVAVQIEPSKIKKTIKKLFYETQTLIRSYDPSFAYYEFLSGDVIIRSEFSGPDYGEFTSEGMQARSLVMENENVQLDGTYTAKAFACLIDDAQKGSLKNKIVLFWNTYCGFDYRECFNKKSDYPFWMNCYCNGPVQTLDQR